MKRQSIIGKEALRGGTLEKVEDRRETRERRGDTCSSFGDVSGSGDVHKVDFRVDSSPENPDKNGYLQLHSLLSDSPVTALFVFLLAANHPSPPPPFFWFTSY